MFVEHYRVLGIPRTATKKQIKDAYKRLANLWHPDKRGGCTDAEERFKHILFSYQVLSDEQKRSRYDLDLATKEMDDSAPAEQHALQRSSRREDSANFDVFFKDAKLDKSRLWKLSSVALIVMGIVTAGTMVIYTEDRKYRIDANWESRIASTQVPATSVSADESTKTQESTTSLAGTTGGDDANEASTSNEALTTNTIHDSAALPSPAISSQQPAALVAHVKSTNVQQPVTNNLVVKTSNNISKQRESSNAAPTKTTNSSTTVVITKKSAPPVSEEKLAQAKTPVTSNPAAQANINELSTKSTTPNTSPAKQTKLIATNTANSKASINNQTNTNSKPRQFKSKPTVKETVIVDAAQIVKWYENGLKYYSGQNNSQQNYTEAARWFRMAAEQGHTGAQTLLGTMYYEGKGVLKDRNEANKWYRKSNEPSSTISSTVYPPPALAH